MPTSGRESGGLSWREPTPDSVDTETTVVYLLKELLLNGW
jgi:hypothetical protein